eukprot:TRINITY_DN5834_c0_g1_i1.p1 TRINITY_DN5834_c0_g1~~TRINITY_DN5834_c0_g1_i1.p1  ORF type:complete len:104 (+),score=5.41 TRINITY_DN5834_c0_g1_i1:608-919(+)
MLSTFEIITEAGCLEVNLASFLRSFPSNKPDRPNPHQGLKLKLVLIAFFNYLIICIILLIDTRRRVHNRRVSAWRRSACCCVDAFDSYCSGDDEVFRVLQWRR